MNVAILFHYSCSIEDKSIAVAIIAKLSHSNWIISFPLLDESTSMRASRLLLLSYYYLPDI